VQILGVCHDFAAGASFYHEEFDDGSLFVFDVHCHILVLAV
jgi:hypothetical protein